MLRSTSAADGRTSQPRGLQALLSPVLKRLRPTPIPVSANPAQAKGSKGLGKPAGCRGVGPIMGSYGNYTRGARCAAAGRAGHPKGRSVGDTAFRFGNGAAYGRAWFRPGLTYGPMRKSRTGNSTTTSATAT